MSLCFLISSSSLDTWQLAQPIRLLLKYTGTEFEDVLYEQGDGKPLLEFAGRSIKFLFVCHCTTYTYCQRLVDY